MTEEFIQRHIGPSKDEQAEMLTDLGLTSVDELVRPKSVSISACSFLEGPM